jgi:hypothetical protein
LSRFASDAIDEVDAPVEFRRRAALIPAAARVPWRLAMLCLVLSRFRGKSATMAHLHIVSWAATTPHTRALLKVWLAGTRPMDAATARLDPALETTLNLALVEGLISFNTSRKVKLTILGADVAAEIDAHDALMQAEKRFLDDLGQLSEAGLGRTLGAVAS